MSKPTHIQMTNGSGQSVLSDDMRPYHEQLRFLLDKMNGTGRWAYCIWRVTGELDPLDTTTWTKGEGEYIQCAGSAAAMTVEMRVIDGDGTPHQIVLGKESTDDERLTEEISWDDGRYTVKLRPSEIFTADEAADAFYDYFLHGFEMEGPYVARMITL